MVDMGLFSKKATNCTICNKELTHRHKPKKEWDLKGSLCGDCHFDKSKDCLLYTSPSPRDGLLSRMPSSA